MKLSAEQITDFRNTILGDYRSHGRSFPWRMTHDPYEILVSEMMLQQTQTLRVLPKYEAWLRRFPDAPSLASAPLADVLAMWNGLGYNRRAKFLQQACAEVCRSYGGRFPRDAQTLESLPGIGPYTARAVSAFAFNNPEAFVETNIRSVFIFFFYSGTPGKVPDSELIDIAAQTVDSGNPREWYYALMDYGAELKKRVKNPSRKSSSYARQSKFEGSLRQARGAILRQLAEKGEATLADIAGAEHVDMHRLEEAARRLSGELMVCEKDGVYSVCGGTPAAVAPEQKS